MTTTTDTAVRTNSAPINDAIAAASEALAMTLGGHAILRVVGPVADLVRLGALGRTTERKDGVSVGFAADEKPIVQEILDRVPTCTSADLARAEALAKAGRPAEAARIRVARARLRGLIYICSRLEAAHVEELVAKYGRAATVINAISGAAGAFQKAEEARGVPPSAPADQSRLLELIVQRLGGAKVDKTDIERALAALERAEQAIKFVCRLLEIERPSHALTWIGRTRELCIEQHSREPEPANANAPATANATATAPAPAPAPATAKRTARVRRKAQ